MQLLSNPRFYILASSVCASIIVASLVRLSVASDQLFLIRTEQLFGYIAIIYWYCALLVTPLQNTFGDRSSIRYLVFCRRAIGVSAAYFATLHVAIGLWGQLGGLAGLALLPPHFLVAVILGFIAFVILAAMAVTSFDKIIKLMTFPRWKLLHRFGYLAGILAMLHIWMIGTHMSYAPLQVVSFVLLVILFRLEAARLAGSLAKKRPQIAHKKVIVTTALWLAMTAGLLLLPRAVGDFNDHHGISTTGKSL